MPISSSSESTVAAAAGALLRRWIVVTGMIVALAPAACGGGATAPAPPTTPPPAGSPPPPLPIPGDVSPVLRAMLEELPAHIAQMLERLRLSLPLNPQAAPQINAKIALLERPTLPNEIIGGRQFVEGRVASSDGRSIPIGTVFPQEQMRNETLEAVRVLEAGFPVLEQFMQVRFPPDTIRLWYGFRVGSSAGSGILAMEDRTTYSSRSNATLLPYDAVLHHELAHTYMGNETLTQFLELYVYNVLQTGSVNVGAWTHTRKYVPMLASNAEIAAVLDVYALLGASAMSEAYRAVYPLRPVSGRPLDQAVIQAFVDQAPADAKALVAERLAKVTF